MSPRRPATESRDDNHSLERSRGRALDRAVKLLSYRSRTRQEIVSGLCGKGFPPRVAEDVAEELAAKGLLDDARLSRDMIESCQDAGRSRSRTYADLRRRGIGRETAEESLRAFFDPEREREAAFAMLRKSLSGRLASFPEPDMESAARKLCRSGFSASVVANAINRMKGEVSGLLEAPFLDTDTRLS